jgi:hypothetical protein
MDTAPGAETATGTVLPFSAISGAVKSIPPSVTPTPPVNAAIASSVLEAKAGIPATDATAKAPDPMANIFRLVKSMFNLPDQLKIISL